MRAMVLDRPGARLRSATLTDPRPGPGQVLLRVCACAVCRTDLHVVDGELPDPRPRVVPGHEIVGRVVEAGPGADRFRPLTLDEVFVNRATKPSSVSRTIAMPISTAAVSKSRWVA